MRSIAVTLAPDIQMPQASSEAPAAAPSLPAATPSEIRAVWCTSAKARHPRGWRGLLPILSTNGINTLFVRCPLLGVPSNGSAPSSHTSFPLDDVMAASRTQGISVHAWVFCWALDGVSADLRTSFERDERLMRDAAGNTQSWLCPSLPENRALLIGGLSALARRGVQGIHLDYIRYPDSGCYAPATRRAFEAVLGTPVLRWPADVQSGGRHDAAFQKFRCDTITAFVAEARTAVRAISPSIRFSAAVFPTPDTAASRGQNWPVWLHQDLLDFACPMIYTESVPAFATSLNACLAAAPASRLIPGLGTGADESQLDAVTTALQLSHVRTRHLAGFAFFALDDELLTSILPSLSLN